MKTEIYNLLAHSGLLSDSQSVELLAGKVPPLEEIITPMLMPRTNHIAAGHPQQPEWK